MKDRINYQLSRRIKIPKNKIQIKANELMHGEYFPRRIEFRNYSPGSSKSKFKYNGGYKNSKRDFLTYMRYEDQSTVVIRFEWDLRNLINSLFANTEMSFEDKLKILSIKRAEAPYVGINLAGLCMADSQELAMQFIKFSINGLNTEDKKPIDDLINLWKQKDSAGQNLGTWLYGGRRDLAIAIQNFLQILMGKKLYHEILDILYGGRFIARLDKQFVVDLLETLAEKLKDVKRAKEDILCLLTGSHCTPHDHDKDDPYAFSLYSDIYSEYNSDKIKLFNLFNLLGFPEIGKKRDANSDFISAKKLILMIKSVLIMRELTFIEDNIGENINPEETIDPEEIDEHYSSFDVKLLKIGYFFKRNFGGTEKKDHMNKFLKIRNHLERWVINAKFQAKQSETIESDYNTYFKDEFPPHWKLLKGYLYSEMHRNKEDDFCSSVRETATLQFTLIAGRLVLIGKQDPQSDPFIMECVNHLFLGIGLMKQFHNRAEREYIEDIFWKVMLQFISKKDKGNLDREDIVEFKKIDDTFKNVSSFIMRTMLDPNEIVNKKNDCAFIEAIKWLCFEDENILHKQELLSIKTIITDLKVDETDTEGCRAKALLENLLKVQQTKEFIKQLTIITQYKNISALKNLASKNNYNPILLAGRITQCQKMIIKKIKIKQLRKDPQSYELYMTCKKQKYERKYQESRESRATLSHLTH